MKQKSKESSRHVEAVFKALAILDCFEIQQNLKVKQIHEMTKLNQSRILRLCGTLESMGYLIHDRDTGLYSLGPRVLSLGKIYERSNTLISLGRPVLQKLARITGESASIYVVDGIKRLCLVREEGTQPIRYSISEGKRLVIYAGAGGKVLLALGPKELRRKVMKKSVIKKLTSNTIVDLEQLGEELEIIRQNGYAFSLGERESDVFSIAVPIYDHRKNVCAAISIAGPYNRFPPNRRKEMLERLLDAANHLSLRLGYKF